MTDYKPGSFFLTRVSGAAGFWIGVGQSLAGEPSRYGHAGIITDTDGSTVEAMPGGAIRGRVSNYYGQPFLVCDGPVRSWLETHPDPGAESVIRAAVVAQAAELADREWKDWRGREHRGVPYSFLDYFALAALHLHLPSRRVRNRVQRSGHMICSELADAVYRRAGIPLFNDDRLPGDVMPSDLAAWAEDWAAHQASLAAA